VRCNLLAQLRGLEAVLDAGSAARGLGCGSVLGAGSDGRGQPQPVRVGGKLASLSLLLYRIGWSVQVAA